MRNSKIKTSWLSLKKLMSLSIAVIMIFSFAACNKNKTAGYKLPEIISLDSEIVAENDVFLLRWDDTVKCVLLENKNTGYVWSTVPFDYYNSEETNVNLNSPVFLEYYSPEDGSLQSLKAYPDCISEGNVSAKKVENGIRLDFHFIDAEATVPLIFTLREDSLLVSVPLKEIKESGRTQIISISVLPYFCGIKNSTDRSSYLFVPSGSGALMYTDEEIQSVFRSFSGKVYGEDAASIRLDYPYKDEPIRMPIFGVANGQNSLMGVIESHDAAAIVKAEAGNFRNGYSTVYSTLELRGGDQTEAQRNNYNDEVIYADGYDKNAVYSVAYYPLSGENSGYNGMAAKYKEILKNSGALNSEKAEQRSYHIKFLGGAVIKKFFMGFPYNKFSSATTFKQSSEILKDLTDSTGVFPAVTLSGYGSSGVDAGEIGGGFNFAAELGSKKDINEFKKLCDENKISVYSDYDIVSFSSNGGGYTRLFNSAKTAEKQAAQIYPLYLGLRTENTDGKQVRLLQREKLYDASQKAGKASLRNGFGISLSTLTNTAYSDYSETKYYIKGNLREQIQEILNSLKSKGLTFQAASANGYAAEMADVITDTPLNNGGYTGLDESIPFYSMVYGESSALYTTAVNLSDNPDGLLLNAVEAGVSPSFTLTADYNKKFANSDFKGFYGTVYKNQDKTVKDLIKKYTKYFEKVADSHIVSHEIFESGVTKTVFSCGIKVYVNRTDNDINAYGTTIKANSFMYEEQGV